MTEPGECVRSAKGTKRSQTASDIRTTSTWERVSLTENRGTNEKDNDTVYVCIGECVG